MKTLLVALAIMLLLTTCHHEEWEPDKVAQIDQGALKLNCPPPLDSTAGFFTALLGGYVANSNIPPHVAGITVGRTQLLEALNQSKGKKQIGLFFIHETNNDKYLWLIGKKSNNYYSTRLPKTGKNVKKCCDSKPTCCEVIRKVPSLCINNTCEPPLEMITNSITDILGDYIYTGQIPPHIPGVEVNRDTLIAALSDTLFEENIGLFIFEEQGVRAIYVVGTDPETNNPLMVSVGELLRICCPKKITCCDIIMKQMNLCPIDQM